ncbi:uncharacterized protein [Phyllobates terribilis]|uniref:uncharacterized protein n=1 Tax=Phyllobates terribilis TaxID=111132 RepID=UPI003CCB2435
MEGGLPILNCLLQHTLSSLCSSSEPSRWIYAVFWRILPRNYPPPKWEYEGGDLDRGKGNQRNWILVWEDGYYNSHECEPAARYEKGRFGADVFFKLSHEVYNYGEGLLGKVAAENSHRWVFKASATDETSCFSSWNVSIDHHPKAWQNQFNSGIQTIALISVRDGVVQLGSLEKVNEDINLVINTQRKFSYLHSLPGTMSIQRPNLGSIATNPYTIEEAKNAAVNHNKRQLAGSKRPAHSNGPTETAIKSINLGWNNPQSGLIGPPPMLSYNFGLLLSKPPFGGPSDAPFCNPGQSVKVEMERGQEEKSCSLSPSQTKPFKTLHISMFKDDERKYFHN